MLLHFLTLLQVGITQLAIAKPRKPHVMIVSYCRTLKALISFDLSVFVSFSLERKSQLFLCKSLVKLTNNTCTTQVTLCSVRFLLYPSVCVLKLTDDLMCNLCVCRSKEAFFYHTHRQRYPKRTTV